MYFIDTHSHISHFKKDKQEAVIERAHKAGVKKLINVACERYEWKTFLELAQQHENMWSTAGLHPTTLTDDLESDMAALEAFTAQNEKVVAIGEIGLDYYHDKFPHDKQEAFFVRQLAIAHKLGLPAVIHCRSSKHPGGNEAVFLDAIHILERENFINGVIHCFSGNMTEAEKLLDLGLMISFTGIITYQNNEDLRKVVKMVPLDRMMLETDCPYLTIESKKGQGEPAFVIEIAKTVAEAKGVNLEDVAQITSRNAEQFFGI